MPSPGLLGARAAGHSLAPPPFSPRDIAGCKLLLRPEGLASFSDGDLIGTWPDNSGQGNNATQGSSSLQPTCKTAILNGYRVVRFSAPGDFASRLSTSLAFNASSPFSIFVVYSYRSATSGGRRAINGGNNWLIGPYNNLHQAYVGSFVSGGPAVTQNVFVIHALTQDSSAAKGYVNGTNYGTVASPGTWPGTINLAAGGAIGEALDGDIAEVIAYDSVLSAGDRGLVTGYLQAKFGL